MLLYPVACETVRESVDQIYQTEYTAVKIIDYFAMLQVID